jgi:Fe-S cluster assembly protein SufB
MAKYTEEQLEKGWPKEYEYGFYTDIESDTIPIGLSEDVVRMISAKERTSMDDRMEARNLPSFCF